MNDAHACEGGRQATWWRGWRQWERGRCGDGDGARLSSPSSAAADLGRMRTMQLCSSTSMPRPLSPRRTATSRRSCCTRAPRTMPSTPGCHVVPLRADASLGGAMACAPVRACSSAWAADTRCDHGTKPVVGSSMDWEEPCLRQRTQPGGAGRAISSTISTNSCCARDSSSRSMGSKSHTAQATRHASAESSPEAGAAAELLGWSTLDVRACSAEARFVCWPA